MQKIALQIKAKNNFCISFAQKKPFDLKKIEKSKFFCENLLKNKKNTSII
jgi:hypothetical protein